MGKRKEKGIKKMAGLRPAQIIQLITAFIKTTFEEN